LGWLGTRVKIKIRFQEILALIIIIPFLGFTGITVYGKIYGLPYDLMPLLQSYLPIVSIILGGYFGQGAIREWKHKQVYEPIEYPTEDFDARI